MLWALGLALGSPAWADESLPLARLLPLESVWQGQWTVGRPLFKPAAEPRWAAVAEAAESGQDVWEVAEPKKRSYRRMALGAAFSLAAGTIAFLSKEAADDAYDRYLHAVSPKRQERNFERAERMDRYAGAALLAMEAGILLTAYWTFF